MNWSLSTKARTVVLVTLALVTSGAANAGAATTSVDFGVTLTGPTKAKVGAEATYTIVVTNAGPDAESPKMRLAGGSGATDTSSGDPIKSISQTPTQGTCKNDGFGITCRLDDIAAGGSATVTVVAQVLGRDLPALDLQATVEPEKASAIDANAANNHVEFVTPIPKPIKIEGVPNRCTSKTFIVRVRTKVEGAKATKLVIDGRTLGSTAKNRLKVKVKAGELNPGTHDLSVIVQPTSGPPLTKEKVTFKTCA